MRNKKYFIWLFQHGDCANFYCKPLKQFRSVTATAGAYKRCYGGMGCYGRRLPFVESAFYRTTVPLLLLIDIHPCYGKLPIAIDL